MSDNHDARLRKCVAEFNAALAECERDTERKLTGPASRVFRLACESFHPRLAAATATMVAGRATYGDVVAYGWALVDALERLDRDLDAALQWRRAPVSLDAGLPDFPKGGAAPPSTPWPAIQAKRYETVRGECSTEMLRGKF